MKHKVRVIPFDQTIEVSEETSLLHALQDNGFYVKSKCGGHANCGCCLITITSGQDNLQSPSFAEIRLLGNVFHLTKERLACQTYIFGDVTVDISAHNKERDEAEYKAKTSKPKVHIKKKSEVAAPAVDSITTDPKKDEQAEPKWFKHWQKEKDSVKGQRKKLGGNKRPKYFNTDKLKEADDQSTVSDKIEESEDDNQ